MAELGLAAGDVRGPQQVKAERLLKAHFAIQPRLPRGGLGRGAFNPVLDGTSIPRHPFEPDAPPVSASVPIIVGYTHHEMASMMPATDGDSALDEAGLAERVATAFPAHDSAALIAAYREGNPGATPWELFVLMSSDRTFGANSILLAERKAAQGAAPVFVYRFDWESPTGGRRWAGHGVDVSFVFDNSVRASSVAAFPEVETLAATIASAWIAFARNGVPSAPALPDWPAYSAQNRKVMLLNMESRVADDPGGAERRALLSAAP